MSRRSPAPLGVYNIVCPYCEKQNIQNVNDETLYLTCPNCSKEFRVFITKVRAKRGRKSGSTREYVIRYISRLGEGVERFVDHGGSDLDIRSGDVIYLCYEHPARKANQPIILCNNTTNKYVKIKMAGCFIATVTCGYGSWEVYVLSNLRDEILLKSKTGNYFIKIYYKISPYLASYIATKNTMKEILRKSCISPIANITWRIYKF